MDGRIQYLNTDMDLTSADDLTELASALEALGVFPLHVTHGDDAMWYATFETNEDFDQPDPNISAMIAAVESLVAPLRTVWSRCTRREFNIGYDCGAEPWAFNQGLSCALLGRIAAAGASVRVTLYPDRQEIAEQPHPLEPAAGPDSNGESSPPTQ